MQKQRAASSDISDVTQTINVHVTNTMEALHERLLQDVPTAPRNLKRRICERINAARTRNALLPVQRLPAEVFLLCVDHYLSTSRVESMWDMGYYRRLQTLSSVCWSWKNTIDNTPALWSRLPRWCQINEHAELCLSRSASHPLAIDCCLCSENVQEFDKRVVPNLGRCSTLRLKVSEYCSEVDHGRAWERFKCAPMPLLEFWTLLTQFSLTTDLDVFAVHPESPLKRVDLSGWCNLSFATPPPLTLTHLSISNIWSSHQHVMDASQFFGVLNQLPAFEHLEICDVAFQPLDDTTLAIISLKNLKHLRLEQNCQFTLEFLRRAVLPSLRRFHVGKSGYYEDDCHDADALERLIHPLTYQILQKLSGSSSLRIEVISAPILKVKIYDDTEDYIEIFFSIETRKSPTLSLQWLNRVLRNTPRPLPLHIIFKKFPSDLSDQSLIDTVASLPHVRSITAIGCSDVNPLVRSLGSKYPQSCPLPELTDFVVGAIEVPVDPEVIEWAQNSRTPNIPPINFLVDSGATSARFEASQAEEEEKEESDSEAWRTRYKWCVPWLDEV